VSVSKPRLGVIIGSTRATRFADKPAAWLMDKLAEDTRFDAELVDLRDYDLPFFNEAASTAWAPSQDPRAVAWQQKVASLDAYLFIVAEYNHSITAALKNALDQAFVEWNHKPFAALGYGGVGGARAVEHLRGIGVELQMVPVRHAVHIGGGELLKVHPMGQNGPMEEIDAVLSPSLQNLLAELHWWTAATQAQRQAA
jgi:NAD(P)H-dependent FMN reductase